MATRRVPLLIVEDHAPSRCRDRCPSLVVSIASAGVATAGQPWPPACPPGAGDRLGFPRPAEWRARGDPATGGAACQRRRRGREGTAVSPMSFDPRVMRLHHRSIPPARRRSPCRRHRNSRPRRSARLQLRGFVLRRPPASGSGGGKAPQVRRSGPIDSRYASWPGNPRAG